MAVATETALAFGGEIVLRRDAAAWGLTTGQLDAMARGGSVVQILRGLFVDARLADDVLVRARAVSMLLPSGAAVCRRTAAWLHGIDPRGPSERGAVLDVECCVPVGRTPVRRPGVRSFVADLADVDLCVIGGVTCTTPERTAMDLVRWLQPHMGLACLDLMAGRGLVDPASLTEEIERWRGDRYVDQARYLIRHCEPRSESFGESWLRLRMVDAGFPRPEVQIWVPDGDGVPVYRLDMGWQERRQGVEYDGEEFHGDPEDRKHDEVRRDDLSDRLGWDVIGVGKGEVLGRSLALELAVGGMLGIEPTIRLRRW